MAIELDQQTCRDFATSIEMEWLCTNGLGGYASGSVAGANTRKYHGLLVVAIHPPVERYVVLSRVEEQIQLGDEIIDLSTNEFADIVHPRGFERLISFELREGPVWRFDIGGIIIEKSITLAHGQDAVVVRYAWISGQSKKPLKLRLLPMLAGRDFHHTIQLYSRPWWTLSTADPEKAKMLSFSARECPAPLHISHNADRFNLNATWWYNFTFRQESRRGYPDREDLWTPGSLEFTLKPNTPVGLLASTRQVKWEENEEILAAARKRHEKIAATFAGPKTQDPFLAQLALAADQFIVRRGEDAAGKKGSSVIAGYPWFEDWGRDTFISLPGLTLVTGRFDIAREILATFADHLRRGLLPNRFPDKAFTPDYNTVDASMWYVQAAYQYWRYSGDAAFLTKYLYPKLCQILESYRDGTDFGIRMDADGLIRAGEGNHQPTWMDAKIGDWVVTPRHGKPVEINALWYANLRVMAILAERNGDKAKKTAFADLAKRVELAFEKTYWNAASNCLFDVIGDDGKGDAAIRPNQLIAVSLPFSPLSDPAKAGIVKTCQEKLLTPIGMRTLAPGSWNYQGRCAGDQATRDSAYHQGTVWPWLIGPFVTAYVKVNGRTPAARKQAVDFLNGFQNLRRYGLGSICEIADGDPPHDPRGCPAQAWSVAEVLRAYFEDVLGKGPKWPHE